jgi:hypothetical protein
VTDPCDGAWENSTKVAGQAAALASLVRLTWLDLGGTAVAGCGAVCTASGPFYTQCPSYGTLSSLSCPSCGSCYC